MVSAIRKPCWLSDALIVNAKGSSGSIRDPDRTMDGHGFNVVQSEDSSTSATVLKLLERRLRTLNRRSKSANWLSCGPAFPVMYLSTSSLRRTTGDGCGGGGQPRFGAGVVVL